MFPANVAVLCGLMMGVGIIAAINKMPGLAALAGTLSVGIWGTVQALMFFKGMT